jgi:uncharacterized protein
MKRKIFDLRSWVREGGRAESCAQTVTKLDGYLIVDFRVSRVTRPYEVTAFGQTYRVLDTGYRWLRVHPHAPDGAGAGVMGHALTVQFDARGVPIQTYVDIHGGEGVTPEGLPWHDDLYLDVLGRFGTDFGTDEGWRVKETELIDQDELQAAYDSGLVSAAQVKGSYAEAQKVRLALLDGSSVLLSVARAYLSQ